MSDAIRFTSNYEDKSTDTGFQFEFFCDICGNGYKSKFKSSATGSVNKFMETAGNIFGGIFSSASNATESVKTATWEQEHEKALLEASKEISPNFIQCPRCNKWVCRERCWNKDKGLCKDDAPDLGVEMATAQAQKSVEEIHAHAAMAEEDKKLATEYWREGIVATCPKCEKPLAKNSKFCPECGYNLKPKDECPQCHAKIKKDAKFCIECGNKL
jgi:membrane protease subunit (stomatin/prohibitin family)